MNTGNSEEGQIRNSVLNKIRKSRFGAFLDTCGTKNDRYGDFEWLAAWSDQAPVSSWDEFRTSGGWRFGIFNYELKNRFETHLPPPKNCSIPVPELIFFEADAVVGKYKSGEIKWLKGTETEIPEDEETQQNKVSEFRALYSREEYISIVEKIRNHIREGDTYEMNFCQEFTAKARIDSPEKLWQGLTEISPVPFSAYYKFDQDYLICASPERFLRFDGEQLITQPIKGTIRRGRNEEEEKSLKNELRNSIKEQAENVMIVDLSRNDLNRSCVPGSVEVEQLFEVQTFPQVHHLVSTVKGKLRTGLDPAEAVANAFPPGSMTGAPKVRTMELIHEYEKRGRGMYSGTAGYFTPDNHFDLNVVIRSLVYSKDQQLLSYHVGGAITWDSDPVAEYEESLLKARAIREVLG